MAVYASIENSIEESWLKEASEAGNRADEVLAVLGAQTRDAARAADGRDNVADPLRGYLQEIGQRMLLTAAQEIELGRCIEEGQLATERLSHEDIKDSATSRQLQNEVRRGEVARGRMTEANLRLVVSIAKRYQNRGLTLFDLIQEGNIGLMRGVEKFDHKRGFRFSTYATWWIRQAILRSLADQGHLIRLPVHMGEMSSKIERAAHRLLQSLGRDATPEELSEATEIPVEKVLQVTRIWQQPVSIDAPLGEEGVTLGDFITEDGALTPMEIASQHMLTERIGTVLADLADRERLVLELRFGIKDGKEYTLNEVGRIMGITRERVRQIQSGALRRLRLSDSHEKLESYID
ncbi:MAG: sigma-70 family RNA polymerase sigma factor [Chloroflexi bacterium]|nr:sigma-70 family RNA polymerase sigma factor [Chloroflexota bacterium]